MVVQNEKVFVVSRMVALLLVLSEIETLRYGSVYQVLKVLPMLVADADIEAIEQSHDWFLGFFDGNFRLLVFLVLGSLWDYFLLL